MSETPASLQDANPESIHVFMESSLEEQASAPPHPQPDFAHYFPFGGGRVPKEENKIGGQPGVSYNVRSSRAYAAYWQCTVRLKGNHCKVTVIERDGTFTGGQPGYSHAERTGAYDAAKIIATVKGKAEADIFKPVSAIVNEVVAFVYGKPTTA